jgi:hypothetical protein
MKKKFPKKIYVKWFESDGELYMTASENAEDLAENVGETLDVGVYELSDKGQVTAQPTFWAKGLPKRKARSE